MYGADETILSHGHHMTITWLSHDCHMTITWQSHHSHMTSHDHHMTVTWHHITVTWQSHDITWPSHHSHMAIVIVFYLDIIPSHTLTPIYRYRWRAKVILLRIPVRDRPEVQLKAIAYGALDQRRPNWGHNRKWIGNYLLQQVCS